MTICAVCHNEATDPIRISIDDDACRSCQPSFWAVEVDREDAVFYAGVFDDADWTDNERT